MTAADVLRAARQRVELGWVQGMAARDARGFPCNTRSAKAVAWCMDGALCAVYDDLNDYVAASNTLVATVGSVAGFNDFRFRRKAEVLEAFDMAIWKVAR